MKNWIKSELVYSGAPETAILREALEIERHIGWPYCPPDEGDLLFHLARSFDEGDALQVGLATGSTALYVLAGLKSGILTSIDYDQNNHERAGERLIDRMGFSDKHRLIEKNSIIALPEEYIEGRRYCLVFLDGWKTFDHIWVDVFYSARMVRVGGYLVFDDARMPAVRKCISLLSRYYGFERVNTYDVVGGQRQRMWHILTTRCWHAPYVAMRKSIDIELSPAGRQYDFWETF